MNKLNTLAIGDEFEARSLEIIAKLLNDGQLGLIPNLVKILPKKKYFSQKRNANIEFDLAIEVWPIGAKNATLIYLIECKHYEGRVPVGKIEEFSGKIDQVADKNIKAVFITNSPLQKAAFDFAKNSGIMLIQGESTNKFEILLYKSTGLYEGNKLPTHRKNSIDEGTELLERLMDEQLKKAFKINSDTNHVSYNIDKLSKEDIDAIAVAELNKIDSRIMAEAHILDTATLRTYLVQHYGFKIDHTTNGENFLGYCDIAAKEIKIDKNIEGTKRELFVLAHEFGHYILHQKLSIGQIEYDSFEDSTFNFKTARADLKNPKNWIEWQANYFAISLILNKAILLTHMWKAQSFFGLSKGQLYVDDQKTTIVSFVKVINQLSYIFNTTKTSIIYRLKEMDKITDRSNIKSIGQIVSEYKEDLFV